MEAQAIEGMLSIFACTTSLRVVCELAIKNHAGSPDDVAVVSWLVQEYQICLIPGSSCGAPGYIRVAFGNLQPELCKEAAARLKIALLQLVNEGMKPNVDAETAAA